MAPTVADPEICPRGGPMTSETCGPARWPSFFWLVLTGVGGLGLRPPPLDPLLPHYMFADNK